MKVEELIKQQQQAQTRNTLPPLQKKVLSFFERHKGEVFSYDDADAPCMLNELHEGDSPIRWSMWALEQKRFLAKRKVGRKTYFGLPEDIQKLDSGLKQKD